MSNSMLCLVPHENSVPLSKCKLFIDSHHSTFSHVQSTLIITSFLGLEKFACYNKTLLYQDYKNNTIQRISKIRGHQNDLAIMKVCYISAHYVNKTFTGE